MIKLVADSSCDCLTMEGVAFQSVPLTVSTDTESWRDDERVDVPAMLAALAEHKGRSYTACPGVEDWMDAFGEADTVYVGVLTSGISGAYNAAMAARTLYLQSHPQAQVHVFDTLSTAAELRLLMDKLADLVRAGADFDTVVAEGTAYLKRTRLFFSLQSLHNFAQNGRVSKVVAATVGVLGIRIVGTASPEGTLAPIAKCRGDARALAELMEQISTAGYAGGRVRVSHVQNPVLAERFAAMLRERYPGADILLYPARGLCSYYAEQGGLLIGIETGEQH